METLCEGLVRIGKSLFSALAREAAAKMAYEDRKSNDQDDFLRQELEVARIMVIRARRELAAHIQQHGCYVARRPEVGGDT